MSKSDLLNPEKHIWIMNNRINIIKKKLILEWKDTSIENIWMAWNWGQNCIKTNSICDDRAVEYWIELKKYSIKFESMIKANLTLYRNRYE